jgi:hypothetical protein
MWTDWDPGTIDTDFSRIASLDANAVRVILQAWVFGYPTPLPVMQQHLAQIVAMAARHHLRVELTLFDWWTSYTDLDGSRTWAKAILAPFAGDPRIAFVELQNEPDMSNTATVTWVRAMTPFLQQVDGGIPVASSAFRLSDLRSLVAVSTPSLLSFHLSAGAERSYHTFQQALRIAGSIPLYIGEAGTSSYTGPGSSFGCTLTACAERYQEHRYRIMQYAASRLGLPPLAVWTLNDFVHGSLPAGARTIEYGFGLFRVNGTAKPVAARVKAFFQSGMVSTDFNGGFEQRVGTLPSEWMIYHASEAQFAWDDTVSHTGNASARISNSTSDAYGGPAFYTSPIDSSVLPGQVYAVSGWVRGRRLTGDTQLALTWWSDRDQYLGQAVSPRLTRGTTGWTMLTARGVAPPKAAYAEIYCDSLDDKGSAWFDDITYY